MLNKRHIIFSLLFALAATFSCTQPEKAGGDDGIESAAKLVSIQYLRSYYKGFPYTFAENYKIRGCVVSDDRSANIINTLILKDDTGLIEVKVDKSNLFEKYFMGTYVELSCSTLTLGSVGGILQLGKAGLDSGFEVGYIPENIFDSIIETLGASDTEILPETIIITDLSTDYLSRYVSIQNVMFENENIYWCDSDAANMAKFIDTDRAIIDVNGNRLFVRTARYAEFSGWMLPSGSGTIEGIVSKYGGDYRLKVIRPDILYATMSEPRFDEQPTLR